MARAPTQQQQRQADDMGEEALLAGAMAATESEIFLEAMGDDEPENDADNSAEQMEDVEGNTVDDAGDEVEDEEDEDEGGADDQGGEGDDRSVADRGEDRGRQAQDQDRQEPTGPRVPSWRAPVADPRDQTIADLQARLGRLEHAPARQEQGQDQRERQQDDLPDPVLDPRAYNEAIERRMDARVTQRVLANNFALTHSAYDEAGRGDEFEYAAGELNQMATIARTTNNQALAQTVQNIVQARDPGRALMAWAERELDLEGFRQQASESRLEQAARLLGVEPADLEGFAPQQARQERPRSRERDVGNQQEQRGQQRRSAPENRGRRLPSLNGAGGTGREGGNSRNLDPRGFDGSESAIFDFAFS